MEKEYVRIQWENRPSIATPLGQINLNKMDYQIDKNENTLITFDTTKANQSDLLQTIRTLTYDTETGIFVFTFWNGSTYSVDLNIEKIPVTFSMDEYGVITMTTADGTTYTCDIGALIKLYTFVDGDEIDFVTTTDAGGNKTITASIKDGSIVGSKLQPNFLADCQAAKAQAELAASSASSDASDAELSSEDSEAWAVGERNGQPVPSTDPAYENNAKWWAQHGTGSSFAGLTDTNFTNLQGGQIARYDDVTQKWINTEDEGGLLPHFKITSEAGSTVTVVCPDTSVIVPTQTSSGIWQCDVPAYGVYTVHAVINGDDAVRTVTVDTVKEYVIHDEHYSYTLNVYAPTGSSIIVTDGDDETYTGTGAGSTAVVFALHQASTTYTITVTYDGLDIDTTITSSATSGGSGSKTITFGTINLTVDEDLIGETIVMAKGTDTVSKVASSTSMVFYPNATGNWTISCQYDGETYYSEPNPVVVSSLSTAVSAEISLVHIPEGATVLPTDDIQTWLKCANLNKSYTTLAEVLADRETFETLIADSNACDYMARSTSWAVAVGLVPTLTGVSANVISVGDYSGQPSWQLFDENNSTPWSADSAYVSGGAYAGYHFDNSVIVSRIGYIHRWDGNNAAQVWKIQGSNDGTNWIDLSDNFNANSSNDNDKSWHYINLNTVGEYSYYRIYEISNSNSQMYPTLMELQFYEADITRSQDAMSLIGKYDYCSNALLGNATWAEAIVNSNYTFIKPLVPTMTSNTTPSGECFSDSIHSTTYYPYKAFDKDSSTHWASSNTAMPHWIGYDFVNPVVINKISILQVLESGNARMKDFIVQGSNTNDSNDWHDIYTGVAENVSTVQYIYFVNNTSYRYYRIYVLNRYGTTNPGMAGAYELQFYGRKSVQATNTNGIIHTAMGNDSVYCVETGDTFTATDGIATVDFSQFDEGVYTFGSTTAKNPNDLTEDFKKRFRITKSPYGGTTERYLLPDTIDTLYWYGYEDENLEDCITANGWSVTNITMVSPTHNTTNISLSSANGQLKGVGTKSKVNLNSVKAIVTCNTAVADIYSVEAIATAKNISSLTKYAEMRTSGMSLLGLNADTSGEYNATCYATNGRNSTLHALWYDRISSDIPTFISAANDSLYIMDGGTKIFIANTNGEGKSYEPLLEAGTYTIYSSVAKDPNNLSNPYSKTVTVDESTQTIAVMPENTLYWWGYIDDTRIEECTVANGWAANSYGATFNTNDIRLYSASVSQIMGIGTKNPINMSDYTKLTVINNGIATAGGTYGACGCNATKVTNTENIGSYTTAGVNKKEWDISSKTGNQYLTIADNANTRDLRILAIILE